MDPGCALFTYRQGRLVRRASVPPKSAKHSTQMAHTAACCSGASASPLRPKAAATIARRKNTSPEVSIFFSVRSKDALDVQNACPMLKRPLSKPGTLVVLEHHSRI